MRISDWSSDVFSSDLGALRPQQITSPMSTSASPRPAFLRNALILGLLTAIGPFAIDMYLPALPSIGASLAADPDAVLMSLTAFFITFAGGQLVYGPVRSAERRVGNECVSTCISRCSPHP